jgi:hypothetical protein
MEYLCHEFSECNGECGGAQRRRKFETRFVSMSAAETRCGGRSAMVALAEAHMFAGGLMESAVERRAARRFSMMLPMKVRFTAESGILEKQGETRDVSFRGLYFLMEAIVEAGSPIEFVLTLPQQITLAGDVHIRCYARVLRVEEQKGRRGVAARIERYEFLPATA